MKKTVLKIIALVISMILLMSAIPLTGFAATVVETGQCGENVFYTLDSDGLLTISGEGEMVERASPGDGRGGYSPFPLEFRNLVKKVIIENGVTSICGGAFESYSNLFDISIPESVKYIDIYAFGGCKSLMDIVIPDSLTSINFMAFYGCTGLTSITIGSGLTDIDSCGFSECDSLMSINIDKNNKKYDSRDNCIAIIETATNTLMCGCKNTVIPDSVTSIGDDAFNYCYNLNSIKIPDRVTSIGARAFCDCKSLTNITIPDSVTNIGEWAFCDCESLTEITIPDSVANISDTAFSGCTGLINITVNSNNRYYCNDEYGVLYNKNKTELIQYPRGSSRTEFTIPNTVTRIEDCAFTYCSSLTSIEIPDGVTSIGSFYGCTGLISITIPDSVTDNKLFETFYNCTNLKEVYLGKSITKSGECAFWNCGNLSIVTITSEKFLVDDMGEFKPNLLVVNEKNADAIDYARRASIPVVTFNYSASDKQLSFNGNTVVYEGLEYNYFPELVKEYPDAETLYFKRLEFDGVEADSLEITLENLDKESENLAFNDLYVKLSVIRDGGEEDISFGEMFELLESGDYDAFKMNLNSDEEVAEQTIFEKIVQAIETFFEDAIRVITKVINFVASIFKKK